MEMRFRHRNADHSLTIVPSIMRIHQIYSLLFLLIPLLSWSQEMTKLDSAIFEAERKIEKDNRSNFKNVESFIVSHKGALLIERYFYGVSKDSLHRIQSQTTSILSLALGIAIDHGFIASEDNLVAPYFPVFFRKEDSLKMQLRIRDLITMSAGMKWDEMLPFDNPANDYANMFRSGNFLDYSLSRPVTRRLNTEFRYASCYPEIVAGIIQKATKMSLENFLKRYLFDQLEIKDFYWEKDMMGFPDAAGGLWMKPADVVKLGVLVLHKGTWKNVRIVSEEWIDRSVKPYFLTPFNGYNYGYFWLIREVKLPDERRIHLISAQGAGGQYLYIIPEAELVVSFTESNFGTPIVGPYIISNYIIPGLE
jgi:CubicO group peptidase (beta-lactamase class C family)